jgi:phospholipid transport system substrate-binding protein
MLLDRRTLLAGAVAGAGMATLFGGGPAWALSADQARAVVQATIDEIMALLRQPGTTTGRASELRRIIETRGNLPQIAKFSAGRVWREMTPEQQQRFVDAFSHYLAVTYSRQFDEYSGDDPSISLGRAIDAGNKGFLVESPIRQPQGAPIAVEWLVSDRGGRPEIVDLIIEGVSLATTQREEIGAKFQSRGQDVDALITDLAAAS